jgi:vancomycin aglycone glucosyltransferase
VRALLSVVGTRGDVQPVIALAVEVRAFGHDVRLCVPPNFVDWAQTLGFPATPVGVEMRAPKAGAPAPPPLPDLIADQFDAIAPAAKSCDVILGANAHQYAAPSIAELHRIPYVNALYAPTALPGDDNTRAWNARALDRVNANRARLGLTPIDDVLRHVVTDRPWLATDPTLDPSPSSPGLSIVQTGAWILPDTSPMSSELEAFLDAGEPPIYFGFGSMPIAAATSRTIIDAARAAGRRAIVSQGWAELGLVDEAPDCISVGDVNQQALFPRVAAVVHHGGAGTTVAAARAGAPQVVIPMFSDQPYWASRVRALGIGTSIPDAGLTADLLTSALNDAAAPAIRQRATAVASKIVVDGAAAAARRLVGSEA